MHGHMCMYVYKYIYYTHVNVVMDKCMHVYMLYAYRHLGMYTGRHT